MSSNLNNKNFYFYNQPFPKEEYLKKVSELWNGSYKSLEKLKAEYLKLIKSATHKENTNRRSENCLGNDLTNCKNCRDCFEVKDGENCIYVYDSKGITPRDSMDCDMGAGAELCYQLLSGYVAYRCMFGAINYTSKDLLYCCDCYDSDFLFGCAGMKNRKYFVLNSEYSKEDYEELVSRIVADMIENKEWGEYFPLSDSAFAYNEALVSIYFPKTKQEAQEIGANWLNDHKAKYKGPFYEPCDSISDYKKSPLKRDELLRSVIRCQTSGRPFRIIPRELSYYMANNIPIPREHPEARFERRFSLLNPRQLWERDCMCEGECLRHSGECKTRFKTTYALERPEKVFCDNCYIYTFR